jgi:cytoskeletal protein CcmA (bactofilin family)
MSKKIPPLLQSQKITFDSILGSGCVIHGKLETKANYHVVGQVLGDIVELEGSNAILWIDKYAFVRGNISFSNVVLAGKLEGNMTVSGIVEVCSGATINGDIESERLHVDPNARINGRLSSRNGAELDGALKNLSSDTGLGY